MKVVQLIELVATSLGLSVVYGEGRRLFVGHSLRVSGSAMDGQNERPALIQLMVRWASDVIAWYVADVPLSNISAIYRRAHCAKDLEELVHESRESVAAARRELARMKDMFHAAFREELRSASAPQAGAQGFPCPFRSYSSAKGVACTLSPTGRSPPSPLSSGVRGAGGSSVSLITLSPRVQSVSRTALGVTATRCLGKLHVGWPSTPPASCRCF